MFEKQKNENDFSSTFFTVLCLNVPLFKYFFDLNFKNTFYLFILTFLKCFVVYHTLTTSWHWSTLTVLFIFVIVHRFKQRLFILKKSSSPCSWQSFFQPHLFLVRNEERLWIARNVTSSLCYSFFFLLSLLTSSLIHSGATSFLTRQSWPMCWG